MTRPSLKLFFCSLALIVAMPISVRAERVKDIARLRGVRTNQLTGYGLVVGLKGSGDRRRATFTVQSLISMLSRMGVQVDRNEVRIKNVAAVMVTASLPPFAKNGDRINVQVSSIGDASSLQGGTLLLSPLRGADSQIYAVAQGPISVGGFSAGGSSGSSVQKNHDTVGSVPGGAIVEKEVKASFHSGSTLNYVLREADFTTATRLALALNGAFEKELAKVEDGSNIAVTIPEEFATNIPAMIARIEQISVTVDTGARVVLNERTGTVVLGENVRISRVAIAHGGLTVSIGESLEVSQPGPLSNKGKTEVVPKSDVTASEAGASLKIVSGATLKDLVRALNSLGVTPRDMVAILQALRAAGALQADLEII